MQSVAQREILAVLSTSETDFILDSLCNTPQSYKSPDVVRAIGLKVQANRFIDHFYQILG
jgi:hypothetical protein